MNKRNPEMEKLIHAVHNSQSFTVERLAASLVSAVEKAKAAPPHPPGSPENTPPPKR